MELNIFSSFEQIVITEFKDGATIKKLLKFFGENFEELTHEENRSMLLKLLDHATNNVNRTSQKEIIEFMCNLILAKSQNKRQLAAALQIVYQFLHILSGNAETLKANNEFDELVKILCNLFAKEYEAINRGHITNERILVCLKICHNKLNASSMMLQELWHQCLKRAENHTNNKLIVFITVQLCNELMACVPELHIDNKYWCEILQNLLQSEQRVERKKAYFLLKTHLQNNEIMKIQHSFWNNYINILESLEESQSHLILPALQAMPKNPTNNNELNIWLNILYVKMLQQKSLPVIRFAMEYLFGNYTIANISDCVLKHLLLATNNTAHYDKNAYCLSKDIFSAFLDRDVNFSVYYNFLNTFAQINWKTIPMYIWLLEFPRFPTAQTIQEASRKINNNDVKQLMLLLSSRIRSLQNRELRQKCTIQYYVILHCYLDNYSLNEYLLLLETLFNLKENFLINSGYFDFISKKVESWKDNDYKDLVIFPERFCDIFDDSNEGCYSANDILICLNNLPVGRAGYFHVVLLKLILNNIHFDDVSNLNDILCVKYNLNLRLLEKETNLDAIILEFSEKLANENSAREKNLIEQCAIIFFFKKCIENKSYEDLLKDLLKAGTKIPLYHLVRKLSQRKNYEEGMEKKTLEIIEILSSNLSDVSHFIGSWCGMMNLWLEVNPQHATQYAVSLLQQRNYDICYNILYSNIKLEVDFLIKGILYNDIVVGDARIELDYAPRKLLSDLYISYALRNTAEMSVAKKLLEHGEDLHKKRSRYYENSSEHRQHVKIAYVVGQILYKQKERNQYLKIFLNILLHQNNQLNVTLMYEFMTAQCIVNFDQLFSMLQEINIIRDLTPSQQVSILSVINYFCLREAETNDLTEAQFDKLCREFLLPLTMGAKFQTRLYAMLVIHSVLTILFPSSNMTIKEAIEIAMGGMQKIEDYMKKDSRMILVQSARKRNIDLLDNIMYMTNAENILTPKFVYNNLKSEKVGNVKSSKQLIESDSNDKEDNLQCEGTNVQRKMNPAIDVIGGELNGLLSISMKEKEQQMYVVTSLIDKIPNLGGIARSCEVLGIKNYVIKNKMLIESHEFKSLSMTAEKSLNVLEVRVADLHEFLMQKQIDGFKIVGAEQTANSENFANFAFPKKCVLLLGHEKEGISPDLLPFLDHAVEIPQFGHVRSLNVHVTGALFMWEYCKQHIAIK